MTEFVSRYQPDQQLIHPGVPFHTDDRDVMNEDPIEFEIVNHRIQSIIEEQSDKLREISASPIVSEANDFNITITDERGDVVAISPYILTHSGGIDQMIKWTIEHRSDNPGIEPGDMFICNDPWIGALHQNDVALIAPLFEDDELFAWTATTLHQVDVGGSDPGGFSLTADDVYDEPQPTPPMKIVSDDVLHEDVEDLFRRRSREPNLFSIDLRAQIAANEVAKERVQSLITEYGADSVKGVMKGMLDRAESKFRTRVSELPDGAWWQTGYIESAKYGDTGVYEVTVEVRNEGKSLVFEVSGDDQVGMINSAYSGLRGGILNVVLPLLCHDIHWALGGINRAVDIESERGTVPDAEHPAAVSSASISAAWHVRNLTNAVVAEMLDSSEEQSSKLLAGCTGSASMTILNGEYNGEPFVNAILDGAGGWGARTFDDGVDTSGIISTPKGRIANVETNEFAMPILYLFRRERTDSGGCGRYRGGVSSESARIPHKTDEPITHLLATFGQSVPQSLGVSGGYPGSPLMNRILRNTDVREQFEAGSLPNINELAIESDDLVPVKSIVEQRYDDIFHSVAPGGGGYGDPLDRDPTAVCHDLKRGLVSHEQARNIYGVVISEGEIDETSTNRLRDQRRKERSTDD